MSLGWCERDEVAFAVGRSAVQIATPARARVALLGTGTVGRAVLARLAAWADTPQGAGLNLVHVANSREVLNSSPLGRGWRLSTELRTSSAPGEASAQMCRGTSPRTRIRSAVSTEGRFDAVAAALGPHGTRILIDATASDALAARHAEWLAQGVHVVTACKLGQGSSLARWEAIQSGRLLGRAHYGDSATVGAGLPLLRTICALRVGGDRILAIAGVLSGSLGWLFANYDGMRPFSALVRDARERGYTEPDPREDLSGEDVRRKLLILARSAGYPLESGAVEVDSLLPTALSLLPRDEACDALDLLDTPLRERYQRAHREGRKLRFIARLEAGRARVGLEALQPGDPLAQGDGCDTRVALWSDRYRERPLVIQGPGAGADVTAAALLDDVLAIATHASR